MLLSDKMNLERVQVLMVDDSVQALEIMGQVICGFGVRHLTKCVSAEEAKAVIRKTTFDIILTDGQMPVEDGYSLVKWIRAEAPEFNRYVPIVLVTGHTPQSNVMRGRDCGANFVVAKPVTPRVLLERVNWAARDERKFVEGETYVGPDRRWQRLGPPVDTEGRRAEDLSGALGAASEPNMSQDEINAMMKPAKVSL